MKKNCQQHFCKVLKILEPNIIIVQGKGIWTWIKKSFETDIKPLSKSKHVYQTKINCTTAYIASFTHPSAPNIKYRWVGGKDQPTEYFLKIVKPSVNRILKEIGL
jgi:uracil-DNA glycosylase